MFHNLHFFFIPKRIAKIQNEKILGLPDVNPLDSRSKCSVSIPGLCALRLSPFRALWSVCLHFERGVILSVNVSFKN